MRQRAPSSYTARRERRRFRATLLRQIATAKRRSLHYQAALDAEIQAVNAALARGVCLVIPCAYGGNASSLRSVDAARYQYAVATTPNGTESRLPLYHDQVWSAVLHQAGVPCGHTSGSLTSRLVDRHPVPLIGDQHTIRSLFSGAAAP